MKGILVISLKVERSLEFGDSWMSLGVTLLLAYHSIILTAGLLPSYQKKAVSAIRFEF